MSDLSRPPIAWTIAGSDSGGGAGIQADLAAFRGFGVYGCSVITALTAQNSFAVGHIAESSHKTVAAQINALDADLPAAAIKLGMLANADTVAAVGKYLRDYRGSVVCDPVVKASSGQSLLTGAAGALVREQLLPRADVLTPNRDEAEALIGRRIEGIAGVEQAAARIVAMGARSVLLTGGHFDAHGDRRLDFWTDGRDKLWLAGPNIDSIHSHGSGCTLSAAIAAALALGYDLVDAIVLAKAYTTRGFRQACQLGGGPGPVAHGGWPDALEDFPILLESLDQSPAAPFPDCGGPLGLYPVVDSAQWVGRVLARGVTTVQLRIKGEPTAEVAAQVREAVALARQHEARLFINDHWQLALEHGAYGVHLGQGDLGSADLSALRQAGLRLGISTHSYREIARAHAHQPSYIALGPIYETSSKAMPFGPQGLDQLRRWVQLLGSRYTLTAIGGIDRERAPAVLATGVGSCAMISAITQARDPEAMLDELVAVHGASSTSG